jgi:hypothetical protein
MTTQTKPAALLRLMAERKGEQITARDVVALHLAARTLEAQAEQMARHFGVYRETLAELVTHQARAEAMTDSLRAVLEVAHG